MVSEELRDEPEQSRYLVGIDLGTTNSAVAFIDSQQKKWQVESLPIPQLVAAGEVEPRETLPSFHYEIADGEFPAEGVKLPWQGRSPGYLTGVLAREHGRLVPGRLTDSAKSWLCHTGVDRTADLLPWHAGDDVERHSPVEISARYLQHIREAWDAAHPGDPLAEQDVVLTLPASFDEVARELTVQAARQAGLPRVVLIEEPQAAFYEWIHEHTSDWHERVEPGQTILVCDIGGGTTDFTLIRVRREADDKVRFHRVAVGDHLILGGDNLDLALAHHLEERLSGGGKLSPRQWGVLVRTCRQVKESLLSSDAPEKVTLSLPGTGSKLVGGSLQTEVTRTEVEQLLLDGFLPQVPLDARPAGRESGFQEFGLPYATDAAMTKHLAEFLMTHRSAGRIDEEPEDARLAARPDVVLLNGGFFASPVLRQRLLDVLTGWFAATDEQDSGDKGDWQPLLLRNERLDLAVSRGAAYYGLVRRGIGERIVAGLARSYYVGVQSDPPTAVCLLPAGIEPGTEVDLTQQTFRLRVSQPIEFPLYISSTRLTDQPGELIPVDPQQMKELPPIRTVLRTRKKDESDTVPVQLRARMTEIGTLDLSCHEIDGGRSWSLQFDIRSATQTDIAAHTGTGELQGVLDESAWQECRQQILDVFGPDGSDKPGGLPKRLAQGLGISRHDWPTSLLRRIWETLIEVQEGRRRSPAHEARWLNLLGFSLRPGYGLALDDWRVAETWKSLKGQLVHSAPNCRIEWWILWRRIGGGLQSGQQQAIASPLFPEIRQMHRQLTTGKGRGGNLTTNTHEAAEVWRLLGSLELLPGQTKLMLGDMLVDLLPKKKTESVRPALLWALGRVGARVPVYGPLNGVLSPDRVTRWLRALIEADPDEPVARLAAMLMARRTGDRYRDIPEADREAVIDWLEDVDASPHAIELVRDGGHLDTEQQGQVFGESLPRGLEIM